MGWDFNRTPERAPDLARPAGEWGDLRIVKSYTSVLLVTVCA